MSRFIIGVLLFGMISILFFQPSVGHTSEQHPVSAQQAVVIDEETGRVLFEKKAYEKRPIASITKVMTAIIAIEYGDLSDEVTVSKQAIDTEGSSIYLQENEKMSLKDLLYGLMLRSGNDAAMAIAEHVGGSVEGFTFLMNEKAAYLGLNDSHFTNPHGLDDEDHYASAYDIALLMRYAVDNEIFREISSTTSYKANNRNYKWFNKNKLLTSLYPHCTGGKTGFTKRAGRTLVSTAEKDGHSLIVVTLNAPSDWQDHIYLYEYFFERLDRILLDRKGMITYRKLMPKTIVGRLEEPVFLSVLQEEKPLLRKRTIIRTYSSDGLVGEVHYFIGDKLVYKTNVYEYDNWFEYLFDRTIEILFQVIGSNRYG